MKKIISILISLLFFIFILVGFQFFSLSQFHKVFEDTNEQVILIEEVNCSIDEFIDIVYDLSEEYETVLFMQDSIYQDGESYNRIYTTDSTFSGNLDVNSGVLEPGDEYGYLAPSSDEVDDGNQAGTYKSFGNFVNYEIKMIDSLINTSPVGNLYVLSTGDEVVNAIYEDLTESTEIQATIIETTGFLSTNGAFISFFFYLSFFIMVLLFICNTYFVISQRKAIAIKKLNGYSTVDITREMYFSYIKSLSMIAIISFGIASTYIFVCDWYFYPHYILFFFVSVTILIITLMFLFGLSVSSIFFLKDFKGIKNNISNKKVNTLNYIFKTLFLFFLIILTTATLQNIQSYQNQLSEYENWEKVSDYYTMPLTIKTETSYENVIPIYKDVTEFYLDQEDVVLIDTGNYYQSSQNDMMLYEENTDFESYSPYGQSIIVNENFLKLEPIYDNEGNIVDVDNSDPYTLTILVPEEYLPYEDQIYEEYLDYFYFHAVDCYNYDAELLGLEPRNLSKEDLKIEIIYIEDNQSVYSYNLNANIVNENYITDAVMVVDNGTFDYSQYSRYVTNGFAFFHIADITNPYAEIESEVAKHDLEDNLRQVIPKSDEVKDSMNELKASVVTNSVKLVLLVISELILIWFIVRTYITSKSKELAIKKMHGYGFFHIFAQLIKVNALIYLLVMLLTRSYEISLIILSLDFICLIIVSKILINKTIVNEIKGKI